MDLITFNKIIELSENTYKKSSKQVLSAYSYVS